MQPVAMEARLTGPGHWGLADQQSVRGRNRVPGSRECEEAVSGWAGLWERSVRSSIQCQQRPRSQGPGELSGQWNQRAPAALYWVAICLDWPLQVGR